MKIKTTHTIMKENVDLYNNYDEDELPELQNKWVAVDDVIKFLEGYKNADYVGMILTAFKKEVEK